MQAGLGSPPGWFFKINFLKLIQEELTSSHRWISRQERLQLVYFENGRQLQSETKQLIDTTSLGAMIPRSNVMQCLLCASVVIIVAAFCALLSFALACAHMNPEPSPASMLENYNAHTSFGEHGRTVDIPKHIHQTWKTSTLPSWASHRVNTWKSKNPQVHVCLFMRLLSVCAWTGTPLSLDILCLHFFTLGWLDLLNKRIACVNFTCAFLKMLHRNDQRSISIPFIRTLILIGTFERGTR